MRSRSSHRESNFGTSEGRVLTTTLNCVELRLVLYLLDMVRFLFPEKDQKVCADTWPGYEYTLIDPSEAQLYTAASFRGGAKCWCYGAPLIF